MVSFEAWEMPLAIKVLSATTVVIVSVNTDHEVSILTYDATKGTYSRQ